MFDGEAMGRRIRRKRQEQGLTQAQFAKKIGVSTSFYGHIERGSRTPSIDTLVIIANALNVGLDALLRGRIPCVTDRVYSVTTPGEVVDAIVTEYGVTINPKRKDLLDAVSEVRGLPLVSMEELAARARRMAGPMDPVATTDRIIGVVEWRDGTVIDVVRQLKK